jgi:hypothetical protein
VDVGYAILNLSTAVECGACSVVSVEIGVRIQPAHEYVSAGVDMLHSMLGAA